jgi:hypothetical protein
MKRNSKLAIVGALPLMLIVPCVFAEQCGMNLAFKQADRNAKNGVTDVWSDKNTLSLLFIESLNVNTDGTRRSYSVEDFWGDRNALNNLCNAMSDGCAGLSKDALRERRMLTQDASKNGWPADQLKKTRLSPSIVPFKNGKPCPAIDGFLVSATALHKPRIVDVCDINNYTDALVTPAIVLPKNPSRNSLSGFAKRNAKVGDLVVAMVPGSSTPVYAVVGDTGPSNELGEGSVALNGKLLSKDSLPSNYREVRGRDEFKGKGWMVQKAVIVVFPGTRDEANPYMSPGRIDEMAAKRFESWGGIKRLNSCVAEYSGRRSAPESK